MNTRVPSRLRKLLDLDTHGREEEAILGRATAPRGSTHRGASESRVNHDPDMVPSSRLDVEVSAALHGRAAVMVCTV